MALSYIFLLNKMILLQRFRFYLVFYVVAVLLVFGLSSSYCGVWFVIDLLRCDGVRCLVVALYLCGSDSDSQNEFDQSNISNYGCQYVEELKSKIF